MIGLRKLATGSGAKQWRNCPGSVCLSMGIVESDKAYATEGTRLHKIIEAAVRDGTPLELVKDTEDSANTRHIKVCVEETRKLAFGPWVVEDRIQFLGSSGQIDAYCINDLTQMAFLVDYKMGVGVRLDAKDNEQMAFYACALKEKYPLLKKIYITLIQPKVEGDFEDVPLITHWTLGYQSLRAWRNKFERALKEVERAAEFRAGNWCQFCKAKPICPAYTAFNAVATQDENMLPAVQELAVTVENIAKIAFLASQQKRIEGWFPKAKEWLLGIALNGGKIPGAELVSKRTNRRYLPIMEEEEIAQTLVDRGIANPWKPRALIPLTAAEALGVDVSDIVEKPEGGKTLKFKE